MRREAAEGGTILFVLEHLKGLQVRYELRRKKEKAGENPICRLPSIHPDSRLKSRWDLTFAVVLVFVCFKEPLHIGFPALFEGEYANSWLWAELGFDIFFAMDMLANALTGYYVGSHLVTDQPAVLRHYLVSHPPPALRPS